MFQIGHVGSTGNMDYAHELSLTDSLTLKLSNRPLPNARIRHLVTDLSMTLDMLLFSFRNVVPCACLIDAFALVTHSPYAFILTSIHSRTDS